MKNLTKISDSASSNVVSEVFVAKAFDGILPSVESEKISAREVELQEKINFVRATTSEQPLARGLGVFLRKIWDALPTFGLPVADAKASDLKDPELEALLKARGPKLEIDEGTTVSEEVLKKAKFIMSNVRDEFRKAAAQGPKTRDLILQCLEVAEVRIYDANLSRNLKAEGLDKFGFSGGYLPQTKELKIATNFEGKYLVKMIKHECSHMKENEENTTYDTALLEECVVNLQNILSGISDHFKVYDATLSEDLKKYSKEYKDTEVITYKSNHKGKTGKRELEEVNLVAKMLKGHGEEFQFFEKLTHVEDKKTRNKRVATKEEKSLYAGFLNLAQTIEGMKAVLQDYENIFDRKAEIHARILEHPERLLNSVCPKGFGESEIPSGVVRTKSSSDYFSEKLSKKSGPEKDL